MSPEPKAPESRTIRTDRSSTPVAPSAAVDIAHAFVDAFNAHDPSAIADLFTSTAWFVDVVGHRLSGRDEIREAHRFAFSKHLGSAHLDVTDLQSRRLGDQHAQIEIAWKTVDHPNPQGEEPEHRHGLLALTLVHQPDTWMVVTGTNNDYSLVWSNTGPQ